MYDDIDMKHAQRISFIGGLIAGVGATLISEGFVIAYILTHG